MEWNTIFNELKKEFPLDPAMVEGNRLRAEPIIRKIKKNTQKGDNILSVGSGPCIIECVLSKMGYNVTAVDELENSWHKLGDNEERIKRFAASNGVEFNQKTLSPENTLETTDFDLVYALDVIEHLSVPRQFLNACIYHICDNGFLLILTPNSAHLARRIRRLMGKPQPQTASSYFWYIGEFRGHIKEYTINEMKNMLSWQKMNSIQIDTIHQLVNYKKNTTESTVNKYIIDIYKNISGLYPPFKDTIIATAMKPPEWTPTTDDVERFKQQQNLIERSNLDNLSNEEILEEVK